MSNFNTNSRQSTYRNTNTNLDHTNPIVYTDQTKKRSKSISTLESNHINRSDKNRLTLNDKLKLDIGCQFNENEYVNKDTFIGFNNRDMGLDSGKRNQNKNKSPIVYV